MQGTHWRESGVSTDIREKDELEKQLSDKTGQLKRKQSHIEQLMDHNCSLKLAYEKIHSSKGANFCNTNQNPIKANFWNTNQNPIQMHPSKT